MSQIKTKKILLVIPSLQAGGMERVMSELLNSFSKDNKLELYLVLYGIKRDIFYSIPNTISIHKPIFEFNNKQRVISTIKTLSFLRKKVKEIKPEVILSFGEYWNNFVLLATYGMKIPVYVSDRSQPDKSLGKFHDMLRKWLYPSSTGVILQTQKAKEIYLSLHKNLNIMVIGNPIREIHNDRKIERENVVLMVGRLIESKHQDRLIKIFSKIKKLDWRLILVGYDHLKQKNSNNLEFLIKKLKIEDRVVLAGKQSDVEKYYMQSEIFAFTSSSEGFPNVIGEAMSAGLPVVAYDCVAGPSEMIDDAKNGYLVPLFDDELFLAKLEKLMNDNNLRYEMGKNAKNSIKKFNNDDISKQFLDFILSY